MGQLDSAEILAALPPAPAYCVAFSGGCDSHALLHLLAGLRGRLEGELRAVHIDHGLNPSSVEWAGHCLRVARELDVPCAVVRVDARSSAGESPEAAARDARYGALRRHLREGEVLLTAQHRDDQAETLLLQLLRGAGPRGLSAMPKVSPFGPGMLVRPLLDIPRRDLIEYARRHRLEWIDDPSNLDTSLDRNFLRHEVLPVIARRWPTASRNLARSARHSADAALLLDELACGGLDGVADGEQLSVTALLAMTPPQRRNLLRYWIERRGFPAPSELHLNLLQREVLEASVDATPCLRWQGCEVRRFRDRLYVMAPLLPHDSSQVIPWDGETPLLAAGKVLCVDRVLGEGIDLNLLSRSDVTVRFRRGGESCLPRAGGYRRSLKALLQEASIPPWERMRVPLVYLGEELAAVAGLGPCAPFGAAENRVGMVLRWEFAQG